MGHGGIEAQGRHDSHSRRAGINGWQCHVRERVRGWVSSTFPISPPCG